MTKPRSFEFAKWVVNSRRLNDQTQKRVAELSGLSQQELSSIERLGVIPRRDVIERIAIALRRDVTEALATVKITAVSFEAGISRRAFMQRIKEHSERNANVGIFHIKQEGSFVPDEHMIDWYKSILEIAPNLSVNLLFRFPEDSRNFKVLYNEMQQLLPEAANRLRAYNHRSDFVEDREKSLPIPWDQILITTSKGFDLYNHTYNPKELENEIRHNVDTSAAKAKAMILNHASPDRAEKFFGYVGFKSFTEVDPDLWIPVTPEDKIK
ncbi:MAG: hypothetical protein JWM56_525 [Candidatus Peribacteria bacterium]|nr:hypothetical protein [Candidatus Peribacteria bacterium]